MSTSAKKIRVDRNIRASHQCEKETTGSFLRRLRLEKGWSTKSISERTRISIKNIQAIEDQDFARLPADTFTRGLVSLYGNLLGVEGGRIADRFLEERHRGQTTDKQSQYRESGRILTPITMAEPSHLSSATIAGIIFLIILILFAGFYFYTSYNPFGLLVKPTESLYSVTRIVTSNNVPTEVSENSRVSDGLQAIQDADHVRENSTPLSLSKAESTDTVAAAPATSASMEQSSSRESVPVKQVVAKRADKTKKTYSLEARFLRQTRVSVVQDDQVYKRKIFKKGETVTWQAAKLLQITFEHPNSAKLILNGSPLMFPEAVAGRFTLSIPEDISKQ